MPCLQDKQANREQHAAASIMACLAISRDAERITLPDRRLQQLPGNFWQDACALTHLDLRGNALRELPCSCLAACSKMQVGRLFCVSILPATICIIHHL
jgi:hypothetical protein